MIELKTRLYSMSVQHWLDYEFLTWKWFLKIFIVVLFIIIFWKFADKSMETIFFGVLLALISTVLDVVGTYMVFWEYPLRIFPIEFSEIHDFIVVPISFIFVFQYFRTWKAFFIADIALSAVSAFVVEPVFIKLDFYRPISWHHIYSFIIFTGLVIFCKYIADIVKPANRFNFR
jgi:hypothetical protein